MEILNNGRKRVRRMARETLFPSRLQSGDEIRVIAPSNAGLLTDERLRKACEKFEADGFRVTFSKNFGKKMKSLYNNCPELQCRLDDLHTAFADQNVGAIIAGSGGMNSNQLLDAIDYDLISKHPKPFCGYSDITALNNAIYAKTGMVTYSGPVFRNFANDVQDDYIFDFFKKCLMSDKPFAVTPSRQWLDGKFGPFDNSGPFVVNPGTVCGRALGGCLCTFMLLQGTEYMPDIRDSVIFIEDYDEVYSRRIDRMLQSRFRSNRASLARYCLKSSGVRRS
jgi:muramoyltetrapeptide carboxypeptidase LdcA involved in peptidoglycan recycling